MKKFYKKIKMNSGMTYIELIVVLGIFSALSSIAIFNYGAFQAKVDIKNLGSDIALKIVEAQKSSLSGLLPPPGFSPVLGWKPSYGIYFELAQNTKIKYFVDLNSDSQYDKLSCSVPGECLQRIDITKNNIISKLEIIPAPTSCTGVVTGTPVIDLGIVFRRPDSGPAVSSGGAVLASSSFTCVQITASSPNGGSKALIKVYPSGRVQVN